MTQQLLRHNLQPVMQIDNTVLTGHYALNLASLQGQETQTLPQQQPGICMTYMGL